MQASSNTKEGISGASAEDLSKSDTATLNLLSVLTNVKNAISAAKKEEKVQIYQKVLAEDMATRFQANAKKKGARKKKASEASKANINAERFSTTPVDGAAGTTDTASNNAASPTDENK